MFYGFFLSACIHNFFYIDMSFVSYNYGVLFRECIFFICINFGILQVVCFAVNKRSC